MNRKVQTLAIALVLCGPVPGAQAEERGERLAARGFVVKAEVERIQNYRINGWHYVDRRALVFRVGASRHYLVTLRKDCVELRGAEVVAFTDTVGNLTPKDRVIVHGPGGLVEHCLIESLYELEHREIAP